MMKCPLCGELARTRSSRDVTTETKERYTSAQILIAVQRSSVMKPLQDTLQNLN